MWRDLGPRRRRQGRPAARVRCWPPSATPTTYDVTVDDDWTSATTQRRQGVPGGPRPGRRRHDRRSARSCSIAAPVRIARVGGALGQDAAEAGIEVTGAAQVVHVDARRRATPTSLPDGHRGAGRAARPASGSTARSRRSATAETADGRLGDDPGRSSPSGGDVDRPTGTPVDGRSSTSSPPGRARRAGRGRARARRGRLRRSRSPTATAATHLVAVELGVFADGMVEVTGDVAAGDQVVSCVIELERRVLARSPCRTRAACSSWTAS